MNLFILLSRSSFRPFFIITLKWRWNHKIWGSFLLNIWLQCTTINIAADKDGPDLTVKKTICWLRATFTLTCDCHCHCLVSSFTSPPGTDLASTRSAWLPLIFTLLWNYYGVRLFVLTKKVLIHDGPSRAGVCSILSQHSILEYFSSFLCILLGIACNNVEYQISPVGRKVEGDNFYRGEGLFLKLV